MWSDFFTDAVLPALISVLTALLAVATGHAIKAINKWSEKQQAQWVSVVMGELTAAAASAVATVNQTFADEARKRSADGKLSADDANQAAKMAFSAAKQQLGQDIWAALLRILGNEEAVNYALMNSIEAKVVEAKLERFATMTPLYVLPQGVSG